MNYHPISPGDEEIITHQLGRKPRDVVEVAHRCPCGAPDVIRTKPRLSDGTPFPTSFYLTCPRLSAAIGQCEASGLMQEMNERLGTNSDLVSRYRQAHDDYLTRRTELGMVLEIADTSAGGMPSRVKCLHALVAHSLAVGPGINPFGDETLALLNDWWCVNPCQPKD